MTCLAEWPTAITLRLTRTPLANRMVHIGILYANINFFAVRFHPGCLADLPWGGEPFDCSILGLRPASECGGIEAIAKEVATARIDWVHTLGDEAELIHDAVDCASVAAARQANVGDGLPMTTWHDELQDLREMADFVIGGGLGMNVDYHLALVVGSESDFQLALEAMRRSYEARRSENG